MNKDATASQASILRQKGLKVTLPRIKVLEIFENTQKRHLTAEEVFMELIGKESDIGLATVYRILMQFVDAGMLHKSSFDSGKAVFELNQGQHHDHLVCVRCGKVEEFFDEEIEARQKLIAQKHGFKLMDHAMSLYGLCSSPQCQAEP